MITVRMLGGAKKSFPEGSITLDDGDITVSGLFKILAERKPVGTPDMDTRNVLVAINGADSSVSGGGLAPIRDGDSVDIIPIIHGGAPIHRFKVGGINVAVICVPGTMADPDVLRKRFDNVRIQSVNAAYVLHISHLRRILEISVEAERKNTLIADRIETDLILRLTGTTQIAEAIRKAGVRKDVNAVVTGLGDSRNLDALCKTLDNAALEFPAYDNDVTGKFKDVSVPLGRTLEEMLAERAAVL